MVSVVITVYNGRKFLKKTIESVISQDYDNLEIIISDDASTDGSQMIVKELAKVDGRIKPIFHLNNLGICKNVNQAVLNCSGDYLLILGQDDLLPVDHISKMLLCFNSEDIVAVFCDHLKIDKNGNVIEIRDNCLHRDLCLWDFIVRNPVSTCGLIMKMDAYKEVQGFRETNIFPNYGEYDLWIRLLKIGNFRFCDSTRALYRRHDTNITNTFKSLDARINVEKYMNKCRMSLMRLHKIRFYEYVYLLTVIFVKELRIWFWKFERNFVDRN